MKTSPRTISPATRAGVEAVLRVDPAVTPAYLRSVLRALDTPPGQTPEFITATDAAAALGVATSTVVNWIDQGRLDGFRIGQRTTAATVASVELMKAHLAKHPIPRPAPADPLPVVDRSVPAPLPDRLAHLATVAAAARIDKPTKRNAK